MHCDQFLRSTLVPVLENFLRVRESERATEWRGKRFAPHFQRFAAHLSHTEKKNAKEKLWDQGTQIQ